MNDQTAQMGFQIGQSALKHGQDYVDQNVRIERFSVGISGLILTIQYS